MSPNRLWVRGFTLLELVVVLGIMGLVTVLILPSADTTTAQKSSAIQIAERLNQIRLQATNEQKNFVVQVLSRELRVVQSGASDDATVELMIPIRPPSDSTSQEKSTLITPEPVMDRFEFKVIQEGQAWSVETDGLQPFGARKV